MAVAVARDAPGKRPAVVVVVAREAHLAKLALVPGGALAPERRVMVMWPLRFLSSEGQRIESQRGKLISC